MNVSMEHIWAHVEKLVGNIGPRVMGSREDQMAMDYVLAQLREWGVETRLHEIACPCWQHRHTSLTLESSGELLPAQACQFSSSCDIWGEVLLIDTIDKVNNAPVAGKICLMPAGVANIVTDRNLMALALEARGAKGLIIDREHTHPDAYDGKIVREPDLRKMPVACVSKSTAEKMLSSRSPVRLVIDASFWLGRTCNIEARIPGPSPGRIFLTAHHDTGAGTPGATDDGVSVAIGLELARLFSGEMPPCELRIVFTGAHERLGQGSADYVRENKELLRQAVLALNFDGIGARTGRPTARVCASQDSAERLTRILERHGNWKLEGQDFKRLRGDVGPFADEAVPAIWLCTPPRDAAYKLTHTQLDDMAAIDMEVIRITAQAAVDIIRSQFWKS